MKANATSYSIRNSARASFSAVRDELRERRQERAERRRIRTELGSYTTATEVDDLLGALRNRDDACADEMRTLLVRNLRAS